MQRSQDDPISDMPPTRNDIDKMQYTTKAITNKTQHSTTHVVKEKEALEKVSKTLVEKSAAN